MKRVLFSLIALLLLSAFSRQRTVYIDFEVDDDGQPLPLGASVETAYQSAGIAEIYAFAGFNQMDVVTGYPNGQCHTDADIYDPLGNAIFAQSLDDECGAEEGPSAIVFHFYDASPRQVYTVHVVNAVMPVSTVVYLDGVQQYYVTEDVATDILFEVNGLQGDVFLVYSLGKFSIADVSFGTEQNNRSWRNR